MIGKTMTCLWLLNQRYHLPSTNTNETNLTHSEFDFSSVGILFFNEECKNEQYSWELDTDFVPILSEYTAEPIKIIHETIILR